MDVDMADMTALSFQYRPLCSPNLSPSADLTASSFSTHTFMLTSLPPPALSIYPFHTAKPYLANPIAPAGLKQHLYAEDPKCLKRGCLLRILD